METLIVGDVHLKADGVLPSIDGMLAERPSIKRVVFTGDICDDWNATPQTMREATCAFVRWVEKRRDQGTTVDIVFGNHDFQYLLGEQGPGTHMTLVPFVREMLFPLGLRMAHVVDGFLVTHAGLTATWASEYLGQPATADEAAKQLNDMLDEGSLRTLYKLHACGQGRGGYEVPGPLWADRQELLRDPYPAFNQIVGHSPLHRITRDRVLAKKDDGSKSPVVLWFCDTFSRFPNGRPIGDGAMLLMANGKGRSVA